MELRDWIGFIGVAVLLVAYFLNLLGRIRKDGMPYLLLNTIGAGMACLASVMLKYWPFIILEGCWTMVSGIGLLYYLKRNTQK